MMKGWALCLALVLSACGSNPQKTYYQLPTVADSAPPRMAAASAHPLWVEHVSVADYLANSGLVYQTNDVQYVIASNNQWASPLEQQLQQALVTNLGDKLPGWVVTTQPQGSDQVVLNVAVTAFHGRYDGNAVVSGEWILTYQNQVVKRPFSLALPQTEDGYDALVKTLAQGWQQVSLSIAQQAGSLH